MNKREEEIKNKKGDRFTYDSDAGLSIVSKGKEESEAKSKEEPNKEEKKIEKSVENNILDRIKKWL